MRSTAATRQRERWPNLPVAVSDIAEFFQQGLGRGVFELLFFRFGHFSQPAASAVEDGLVDLPIAVGVVVVVGLDGLGFFDFVAVPAVFGLVVVQQLRAVVFAEKLAKVAQGGFGASDKVFVFDDFDLWVLPIGQSRLVVVDPAVQPVFEGGVADARLERADDVAAIAQHENDLCFGPNGKEAMNLEDMWRSFLGPAGFAGGGAFGIPAAHGILNAGVGLQEDGAFRGDWVDARVVAQDGKHQRGAAVAATDDENGVVDLAGQGGFDGKGLALAVGFHLSGIELEGTAVVAHGHVPLTGFVHGFAQLFAFPLLAFIEVEACSGFSEVLANPGIVGGEFEGAFEVFEGEFVFTLCVERFAVLVEVACTVGRGSLALRCGEFVLDLFG